ncbi:hypothetical protein FOMPIDRAFT_1121160 [Fomitopsis schrenkii]|uniref:BTB domain-containing protein n=1 Tax=Fomitopsis schrenkii TaxID=2126942 RepID=S8FSI2_FOMSC|nr:hypothetical protein FOMPIDRAFT_1121160 [Fomitopsis schrenkii]
MAANETDTKQKTSTTPVDFVPSTDVWYTDGSVVLVAEKTAFRVHCTILAAHCEIFKDMFNIPQPSTPDPSTETHEGHPVVRLQDAPVDLKHFLKAIYDFGYFQCGGRTKFPVVAAVLRLATKYEAPVLRQRAIDFLTTAYPSTLEAWDRRSASRLVPPFEDELARYIELAVDTNVRIVLPALYYAASKQPLARVHDTLSTLAVAPSVQWDILGALVVGREQVLLAEQTAALAFLQADFPRPNCQRGSPCPTQLVEAIKRTLPKAAGQDPYYQGCLDRPHEVGQALSLCTACQGTVSKSIIDGKKKVWRQLPVLFGLPDWATLEAMDGLDSEKYAEPPAGPDPAGVA